MKKTVLVTGCNGFIGKAFIKRFSKKYHIIGIDKVMSVEKENDFSEHILDVCDTEGLRRIFRDHTIDVVIHTAAEKSLIKCENDRENAYTVNYLASVELLRLAGEAGSKFIFISSDQVFDGTGSMYSERSPVNAINYYGRLKILTEHQLLQHPGAAICRTALVFGDIPKEQREYFNEIKYNETLAVQGFIVQQTLACLKTGKTLILPDDEFVSPTHVNLLADQLDHVIMQDASGILHCCGKDRISRYEMGKRIAARFRIEDFSCIKRKGMWDPLRPKDVSLDCSYTESVLGMEFMSFSQMLQSYVREDTDGEI